MKPYNDFTLVFQGPLHKNFIYGLLNNYKEYTDHIVISHWDTDDTELLEYLDEAGISYVKVTNTFKKIYLEYNNQNVAYQVQTSLAGIKKASTPYTLKMRTDQWFGNLVPFFEAVRANQDKYVCANLHFRPDGLVKYHPSDKLIGSRTERMYETFVIAQRRLTEQPMALMAGAYMFTDDRFIVTEEELLTDLGFYSYTNINRTLVTQYPEKPLLGTIQIIPGGYIGVVPEVLIGTSFLLGKGIYPSPKRSVEIVKEHFHIVQVEDMVPYVNKEGSNHIEHNSQEIHRIEDYG